LIYLTDKTLPNKKTTPTAPKNNDELEFGEPAEVLVELAKRGELDPWDVDIAKTTEKFLLYIDSLQRRDLRIPARTLLYASILLRMKSDSMEGGEEVEPLPDFEDDWIMEEKIDQLPSPPLRRHTKRPVTLEELILELKKAEMVGRRKALREKWPEVQPEKTLDLSHEEGIEEHIKALEPILDDMFGTNDKVSFDKIKGNESIMNYVSLLFMAQRKQIWLTQEKFFDDLYIKHYPDEQALKDAKVDL
jgi:segregation and condensation protein A